MALQIAAYGFCLIGITALICIGISLLRLDTWREDIAARLGFKRLRLALRLLTAIPLLLAVALAASILLTTPQDALPRLAHAAFALGMWTISSLAIFTLALQISLRHEPTVLLLTALIGALPPTLYFTDWERFNAIFSFDLNMPLVTGAALMLASAVFCSVGLSQLTQSAKKIPPSI